MTYPETQIFYESPFRVADTLANMLSVYGNRQVVLVRELTKLYEEYQRGSISELLSFLEEHPLKGECLLIVEGQNKDQVLEESEQLDPISLVKEEVAAGAKPNAAIKSIAKKYKLNRQELYQAYHELT